MFRQSFLALAAALILPFAMMAATPIGQVKLIGGSASEVSTLKSKAQRQGWTVIESNLNAGNRGDVIYLCYKESDGSDYITDLYLSSGSNPVPASITVGSRKYTLCPYEGGSHFIGIKGDLNSSAGGDDIHLYYTKDSFGDGRAVTDIWFNASSSGAVKKDTGSVAYDLNKGAGGDDIFMHFTTTKVSSSSSDPEPEQDIEITVSGNGKAISEVKLIGGSASEVSTLKSKAQRQGWTVIESNLNAGTQGDVIYLCYKTATDGDFITDFYLSSRHNPVGGSTIVNGRNYTLCSKEGGIHFEHIDGDLNSNAGGEDIHLYYTKDSFGDGRAVTEIWFNDSPGGAVGKNDTNEAYDLNKGAGGDYIYMHFSTGTASSASTAKPGKGKAISEVKLIGDSSGEISSLKSAAERQGWTVIESNLNAGTRGDVIYLCYKTTSGSDYITGLYLSSSYNPVSASITVDGRTYELCPNEGGSHFTSIKGDLNSYAGGDDIHLYYTKDSFGDGRAVTEIWFNGSSRDAVGKNGTAEAYDLNKGAGGDDIFMHFRTK